MAEEDLTTVLRHIRKLVGSQAEAKASDAELVKRFATSRDEAAFEALLERHGPMVLGVCRRILRPDDAEDAFQAAFLVLARKASSIRRGESLAGWLYEVAYHVAVRARAEAVRRRAHETEAVMAAKHPAADQAWDELQPVLDEELKGLPQKYRLPLVLCYLQGKSQRQAARELGWPEGSMSRRLARGKELLRRALTRRGVVLPTAVLASLLTDKAATAAVPAGLAQLALRSALLFAEGSTTGIASAQAAAWANETLHAVLAAKAKLLGAVVLAAGLAAGGAGVLAQRQAAQRTLAVADVASNDRASAPSSAETDQGPARPQGEASPTDLRARKNQEAAKPPSSVPLPPGALARMGAIRFVRAGERGAAVLLPDGRTIASAGQDNRVRLWDLHTRRQIHDLEGNGATLLFMAISSDGKTLASLPTGQEALVWDLQKGGKPSRIDSRKRPGLLSMALAPDGKSLVLSARDELSVWDAATGKRLHGLRSKIGEVYRLHFSPDGKVLAGFSKDGALSLWDFDGKLAERWKQKTPVVWAMVFSRDAKTLATGSEDGLIRLWDVKAGKHIGDLKGHENVVCSVDFSGDGKTLASAGVDGTVRLWQMSSGKEIRPSGKRPLGSAPGLPVGVAFAADDKMVVSLGQDLAQHFVMRQWDVATGREIQPPVGHDHLVSALAFSPDGEILASGSWDRTVCKWRVRTGERLLRLEMGPAQVVSVAFSADGKSLAAGSDDGRVNVWDLGKGKLRGRYQQHPAAGYALAFCSERKTLLLGSPRGSIVALDTGKTPGATVSGQSTSLPGQIFQPPSFGYCAVFSPDVRTLGTVDRTIHLWDVASGEELRALRGPYSRASVLALSSDGRLLASADSTLWNEDFTIPLWEVASGKIIRQFRAKERVASLAFSPDGKIVLAGSYSGAIEAWDVAGGQEVAKLAGHDFGVTCLAFSPDGTKLASGSCDTTILIWDVASVVNAKRQEAVELEAEQLDALWGDLASEEAPRAYGALFALAAGGKQCVALLKDHLRPVSAAQPQRTTDWLDDLNSDKPEVRRKATQELQKLGESAEPALRRMLQGQPAPAARRIAEWLLSHLGAESAEGLRKARALQVLERLGTAEARELLRKLAAGAPDAWLTQDATAALNRLARRGGGR